MKPRYHSLINHSLAIAATVALTNSAHSASKYWDASATSGLTSGTGTWGTDARWATSTSPGTTAPGAWATGDDAFFQTGGTNTVAIAVGGVSANSLTQTTNGTATTISSGGGALTITGTAGIVNSGNSTLTINSAVTLSGGSPQTYTFNAAAAITIGGNIGESGTATISKIGAGTLTLNGDNSFSGGLNVGSTGAVTLGHANAAGGGTIALASTSTSANSILGLSGGVSVSNAITLDATTGRNNLGNNSGSNAFTGNITINGTGNIQQIQNNATGTTTFTIGAATPNTTTITSATFASNLSFRGTGTSGVINSRITAASATIDFNGAANWTINSTGNNWGATTGILSTGNVILGATDALDTGARLDHSGAGDLDLNGFNQTIAGLNRTPTVPGAQIINNSSTTNSQLTLSGLTSDYTYANVITDGSSRNISLVMSSAGRTQTLSGTNNYTGGTTVNAGVLLVTKAAALPAYNTSAKVVFNGGTVGVRIGDGTTGWTTAEVDSLLTSATKTSGSLGIDTTNGNITQWTAFTTTNFGSVLGLVKLSTNNLTLDQTNTYSGGTTVQGIGSLIINGSGSINPTTGAALSVIGNGTLQYNSSAGSKFAGIIVGNGTGNAGTLNQTNGTINATSLSLGATNSSAQGAVTIGNVNGNTATMNVSGDVSVTSASSGLSSSVLTVNATGALAITGALRIATNSTRDAIGSVIQNGGPISASSLSLSSDVNDSIARNHRSFYSLNGGTLSVGSVSTGAVTTTGTIANTFNFNGGIVKATASSPTFWASSPSTSANVYGGGALIDTDNNAITIGQDLLATNDFGVGSYSLTNGGSGYSSSSNNLWVTFNTPTGSNARAATGYATTNASGNITGIFIIDAGNGYTSTPTITSISGAAGTGLTGTVNTTTTGGGLTKFGIGTLTLSGNSTYTGPTTISEGTLTASNIVVSGGSSHLGNATTAVTLGGASTQGTLSYTGDNATFTRGFTIGGAGGGRLDVTTSGKTLQLNTGNITGSGLFTVGGAGNTTIHSNISHAGGLTKSGAGTLTLSNTGTYSYSGATNVSEGTLVVNGNITTSNVTVSSGATIGGSGTVGALTIQSGGFVNPGNSPGILNTGNYNQVGTLVAEITGLNAGTQHDQINVIGTVTLSGALDIQASGGTYALNNMIFLILNDGVDAVTGTFSGLAQGATAATFGGFDWIISYEANSTSSSFTGGNDVALRAIPEPSAALLGGLSALALLRRRRR